jgi:hypothetical protein
MEVTDQCLQVAEQAFKAPAVDVYVTNEFGVLAWSCPVRRNVLHVNDDAFVVEVLDAAGTPVADYTVGELVVTSLGLTSMPLIRYRMGDMAARLPGRCACGRGLGLMSRVHGRTAHAIRRPSGALITTPLITSLFGQAMAHTWVRRYQVREEPGGHLRFLVNLRQRPSDAECRTFERVVESTVGDDFEVAPLAPLGAFEGRPRASTSVEPTSRTSTPPGTSARHHHADRRSSMRCSCVVPATASAPPTTIASVRAESKNPAILEDESLDCQYGSHDDDARAWTQTACKQRSAQQVAACACGYGEVHRLRGKDERAHHS